jgi:excisionase family DNA binding protein
MTDRFDLLADRLAERVVDRVAAMLDERDAQPPPLLDSTQAARFLGISRKALYRKVGRGEVPAIRIGNGKKPRMRFDPRVLAGSRNGGP